MNATAWLWGSKSHPLFQIGFWMLVNGLMFTLLVWLVTPEFNKASTVKHHYCTQLAEQVVGGDVELDRYMNTDCRLSILAEAEGLRL